MKELIKRLTAATEGSRELDLDILRAISGKPWRWVHWGEMDGVTWDQYGPGAPGNPVFALEEFSTSLDAALTLVPEGMSWEVRCSPYGQCTQASCWHPDQMARPSNSTIYVVSPALALVIAALRAREQQP